MFTVKDKNLIQKLPFGFRDIFPTEAYERRCIEEIIRREFVLWGYGEVKTPVFEYTKNISTGVGKNWKDKLISFFDNDGNLVSLRADMTIPIARLSGMRLKEEQLPARFYYFANSFRQSGFQKGEKRVLEQAGLEFIGARSLVADVEVLTILINIMKSLMIKDFKIGLGNIKLIEGLFEWFDLNSNEIISLMDFLIFNDFVSIKNFLTQKDLKKAEIFLKLVEPAGNIETLENLISAININKVKESFNYLKDVYKTLYELGFSKYLIVDFSIIRQFSYYSGLIFEIYSPSVKDIIGSGGRYDGLIKEFGLDVPAVGFALDVDILHKSIDKPAVLSLKKTKKSILFGYSKQCIKLINYAEKLKSKGIIVELFFDDDSNIEKLAKERKANFIYKPNFEKLILEIKDLEKNTSQIIKLE